MVKFNQYAQKDDLKRVAKARKMLLHQQVLKRPANFSFSPREDNIDQIRRGFHKRPKTICSEIKLESTNKPVID